MDHQRRRGFTLVELLVVIGIIALLIGILIPVVSKVRANAYIADTRNWLSQLSGAIERYHSDFRAYPGPLSYMQVHDDRTRPLASPDNITVVSTASAAGYDSMLSAARITGTENLVLGLLGGLRPNPAGGAFYDPAQVGLGPMVLNPNSRNAKRYAPYLEPQNLSWQTVSTTSGQVKTGHYFDDATGAAGANDTIIPEFMDRFPTAMPILYLRSRVGVDAMKPGGTTPAWGPTYNSVITDDPALTNNRAGPYDLSQIKGYTDKNSDGNYIGTGREIKLSDYAGPSKPTSAPPFPHGLRTVTTSNSGGASLDKSDATNYQYPYDAFAYFLNPNFKGLVQDTTNYPITPLYPRQKDGFILIAPGRDRTYGTSDDICSFGDVNP